MSARRRGGVEIVKKRLEREEKKRREEKRNCFRLLQVLWRKAIHAKSSFTNSSLTRKRRRYEGRQQSELFGRGRSNG